MKYIEYTVAREYSTGLMKEESSGHIQIEFIDYIELLLNKEQRNIFLELSKQYQEEYIFKTMKEIKEDRYIKDEEIEFLDRDNFKKGEKIYKRSVSNQLEKKVQNKQDKEIDIEQRRGVRIGGIISFIAILLSLTIGLYTIARKILDIYSLNGFSYVFIQLSIIFLLVGCIWIIIKGGIYCFFDLKRYDVKQYDVHKYDLQSDEAYHSIVKELQMIVALTIVYFYIFLICILIDDRTLYSNIEAALLLVLGLLYVGMCVKEYIGKIYIRNISLTKIWMREISWKFYLIIFFLIASCIGYLIMLFWSVASHGSIVEVEYKTNGDIEVVMETNSSDINIHVELYIGENEKIHTEVSKEDMLVAGKEVYIKDSNGKEKGLYLSQEKYYITYEFNISDLVSKVDELENGKYIIELSIQKGNKCLYIFNEFIIRNYKNTIQYEFSQKRIENS